MNTRELLTYLVFSLLISLCCIIAYEKFFAEKLPRIYVVDIKIIEEELRRDLLAMMINNKGIIPSEDYILAQSKKINTIVEKIAQENKAIILYKSAIIADKANIQDISFKVLEIYKNTAKE